MNPPRPILFHLRGARPDSLNRRLCLVLCFLLFTITGYPQYTDLPYTSPSTGIDGPLVIRGTLPTWHDNNVPCQVVYDASRGYLMAIGRGGENFPGHGTLIQFDGRWTSVASDREVEQTSLVYDEARAEVLRFGGFVRDFNQYRDWLHAWRDGRWINLSSGLAVRPAARANAVMAYDAARQEVVMYGGNARDGFTDTWVWNGTGWTEKSPATNPGVRRLPNMAFDAARGELVLFGGSNKNDTWIWDGSEWTKKTPPTNPPSRTSSAMAYDPVRQIIVLVIKGNNNLETWEWDGVDWTKVTTTTDPGSRDYHGLVYNGQTSAIELYNGRFPNDSDRIADSWSWDGSTWSLLTISPYLFDMSSKPDGIWHYTSIDVGTTEVRFIKNEANTPVVWLATEEVVIDGHLNLDGTKAYQGYGGSTEPFNTPAPGGPGGFDGGLGGYYETATGANVAGNPGVGPGGGAGSLVGGEAGDRDGFHAKHYNVYNSSSLQALSGGSGGGGAASTSFSEFIEWGRGGNGGGGGGSILIASSRDIWINGKITASGGEGRFETFKGSGSFNLSIGISQGGSGSGGSIRLVGDRVLSSGFITLEVSSKIDSRHDRKAASENRGRIRIESYFHREVGSISNSNNHASFTTPKSTLLPPNAPALTIDSIAGQSVSINPSSDPASPEVTFSSSAPVEVIVSAQNIPDGTTVNLRVTSGSVVVLAEPQVLAGGAANFSVSVPAGKGIVQTWTNPEPAP